MCLTSRSRPHLAQAVLSICLLLLSAASACAEVITILDENFDDVTWGSSGSRTHGRSPTPSTAASILSQSAGQLPPGTEVSSPSPADVNVRSGPDPINTKGGAWGFDSLFAPQASNKFLVLGDGSGPIRGNPQSGTFWLGIPFSVPEDAVSIDLSYLFAFDGSAPKSTRLQTANGRLPADFFEVFLVGSSATLTLQSLSSSAFGSGTFHASLLTADLPDGDLYLRFELRENPNRRTNTAVGIDNILITANVSEWDEPYPPLDPPTGLGPPYTGTEPGNAPPTIYTENGPASPSQVPAPGSLFLLGSGAATLGLRTWRRSRRA